MAEIPEYETLDDKIEWLRNETLSTDTDHSLRLYYVEELNKAIALKEAQEAEAAASAATE